jgi:hypothetical protein
VDPPSRDRGVRRRLVERIEVAAFRVGQILPKDLHDFARELGPKAEEAYVTAAQKLTEEALAKGRAEGEARGRAEVVLRQLTLRFGPLPADVAERVRGADVSLLDDYAERLLTAQSLEDVLR